MIKNKKYIVIGVSIITLIGLGVGTALMLSGDGDHSHHSNKATSTVVFNSEEDVKKEQEKQNKKVETPEPTIINHNKMTAYSRGVNSIVDKDGKTIKTLKNEEEVKILGVTNTNVYAVDLGNSKVGYIKGSLVKAETDAQIKARKDAEDKAKAQAALQQQQQQQQTWTEGYDAALTQEYFSKSLNPSRVYYGVKAADFDAQLERLYNGASPAEVEATIRSWKWQDDWVAGVTDLTCVNGLTVLKFTLTNTDQIEFARIAYPREYCSVKVYRNSDGSATVSFIAADFMTTI